MFESKKPCNPQVRWINIMGLSWELVLQLARRFDLHPLAVEDLMHTPQRIKVGGWRAFSQPGLLLWTAPQQQPYPRPIHQHHHHKHPKHTNPQNCRQADFYENHLFVSLARFSIRSPSTIGDPSAQASRAASFAAHGASGGAEQQQRGPAAAGRQQMHPSRSVAMRSQVRENLLHSSSMPRTAWLRGGADGGAAAAAAAAAAGMVLPMELTVQQVRLVGG